MNEVPDRIADDENRQDALLVKAACNGNQGAFDQLVDRYQRRAVAVAYRMVGSIHDAADVAQNAFLRAYQNLARLEDAERFGPWLMRIVTNQALNFRRTRSRGPSMTVEPGLEEHVQSGVASATSASNQDIVAQTQAAELQEALAAAVEELPEKQRTAFMLFSIEGVPQKEVAEMMDCSVQLVKWNVFQARKKLREKLASHLE